MSTSVLREPNQSLCTVQEVIEVPGKDLKVTFHPNAANKKTPNRPK
jgi:hypothetical protein